MSSWLDFGIGAALAYLSAILALAAGVLYMRRKLQRSMENTYALLDEGLGHEAGGQVSDDPAEHST